MNVFEVFAKLDLDSSDYKNKLENAKKLAVGFGKASAAVLGAGATAAGALTKKAVDAYSNFEQLKGGVETLFGKSANKVLENSRQAFESAGMSVNEYMQSTIQGSAAMIKSLDGDQSKAAKLMDMSIVDMSDNVNKMGTNMQSVQDAYRGFSRSNFTMLDNLALGYAGTKTGMQELLADAQKISGVKYDISSYADIVQAIHVVQEQMKITGTTSKEAAGTIEGSTKMMQASWQNLITGLANPDADLNGLIDQLVASVEGVWTNISPVISKALSGIGTLVSNLLPKIVQTILPEVQNSLPLFISAIQNVIGSIGDALPGLTDIIISYVPTLLETVLTLSKDIGKALFDSLPQLIDTAFQVIDILVNTIINSLMSMGNVEFWNAIMTVLTTLTTKLQELLPTLIPNIVSALLFFVQAILDNLSMFIDAAIAIIMALSQGLINALPILIDQLPIIIEKIILALTENAPKLVLASDSIIIALAGGLIKSMPKLIQAVPQIVGALIQGFATYGAGMIQAGVMIVNKIKEGLSQFNPVEWAKDMVQGFIDGIKLKLSGLGKGAKILASTISKYIHFSVPDAGPLADADTYMPDMIDLFVKGMKNNTGKLLNQVEDTFDFGNMIGEVSPNSFSISSSDIKEKDSTYALLQQYLPQLANLQIALDGNKLVGGTVNRMDKSMGNLSAYAKRGLIV